MWTDPTWLAGIVDWARDRLEGLGHSIVGPVEQPHVRPLSTVLRTPTDRGPMWCKTAGPGTAHEARLLAALAAWDVRYVLLPLDADQERG